MKSNARVIAGVTYDELLVMAKLSRYIRGQPLVEFIDS